jgi:hypothetical protein
LVAINNIVENIPGDSILIYHTRNSLREPLVFKNLFYISESHSNLIEVLNKFEEGKYLQVFERIFASRIEPMDKISRFTFVNPLLLKQCKIELFLIYTVFKKSTFIV